MTQALLIPSFLSRDILFSIFDNLPLKTIVKNTLTNKEQQTHVISYLNTPNQASERFKELIHKHIFNPKLDDAIHFIHKLAPEASIKLKLSFMPGSQSRLLQIAKLFRNCTEIDLQRNHYCHNEAFQLYPQNFRDLLKALPNLQSISLSNQHKLLSKDFCPTIPPKLSQLSLSNITIGNKALQTILKINAPTLESLKVADCKKIKTFYIPLKNYPKLTKLVLQNISLSPACVHKILIHGKSLSTLSLSTTEEINLSTESIKKLPHLEKLIELRVTNNSFSGTFIQKILSKAQYLRSLSIHNNENTKETFKNIVLPELQTLNFTNSDCIDTSISDFINASNTLSTLDLIDSTIDSSIIDSVTTCNSLKTILLSSETITKPQVAKIAQLPKFASMCLNTKNKEISQWIQEGHPDSRKKIFITV